MTPQIIIRELVPGEEPVLWALFRSTIRNVSIRDYSPAQVNAWAPADLDEAVWRAKIQTIKPFVAMLGEQIAGYSDLQSDGLIDHLFVHYQYQRRGVATALMREIESRAERNALKVLKAHVSITARPFFEASGFSVAREQGIDIRGERLTNYLMHKNG